MTRKHKLISHLVLFSFLFFLAIFGYQPLVEAIDQVVAWDFSHTMFVFGIVLGLIYIGLELLIVLCKNHQTLGYLTKLLPSLFVLNAFIWYFYLMASRIVSETKEDASYFQTIIIAFSVFFLLVKITKEVKTILKNID